MAIETEELIKIILGIIVIAAVIVGVSVFFGGQVIGFFKGLSIGKPAGFFLAMIK
jgi:hypothetical protein